jgi:hypothetical protein
MTLSGGTFTMPRLIRTAPNGDLFLADSGAGTIFILRGVGPDGKAAQIEKFATGLDHPFGIAFYPADNPKYIYVGNATTVQRIPYHSGDLHANAAPETIVPDIPGYAQLTGGGHWTRDIVFTKDGRHMLVSVGSGSNADDPDTHPKEFHRADVLEYSIVSDFSSSAGAEAVIARLPVVDVPVNNVGIFEPKPFAEIPDADWYRFFEINVMSGVRLARYYLAGMLKNNWGRILFISSESAVQAPPEMVHYGMTKTA